MKFINPIKEQNEILNSIGSIYKATCCFSYYKTKTTEIPSPNGCGILVYHNEKYYCLSNAHVLCDNNFSNTFINIDNNTIMTIGGNYQYITEPTSGRKDDPFDIAIVQLNDESVKGLKKGGFEFINITEIMTGFDLDINDCILIIGFPGSKKKINIKNKTTTNVPFILFTKPHLKGFKNLNFNTDFHFFVKYSRNKIYNIENNKIKTGPKPHGISGSGVWVLRRVDNNPNKYQLFLIGIFTEYLENSAILISTKIDLFIDIIRQKFDPTIINKGVEINQIED